LYVIICNCDSLQIQISAEPTNADIFRAPDKIGGDWKAMQRRLKQMEEFENGIRRMAREKRLWPRERKQEQMVFLWCF
jgi:hypothetical protein